MPLPSSKKLFLIWGLSSWWLSLLLPDDVILLWGDRGGWAWSNVSEWDRLLSPRAESLLDWSQSFTWLREEVIYEEGGTNEGVLTNLLWGFTSANRKLWDFFLEINYVCDFKSWHIDNCGVWTSRNIQTIHLLWFYIRTYNRQFIMRFFIYMKRQFIVRFYSKYTCMYNFITGQVWTVSHLEIHTIVRFFILFINLS